MKKSLKKKNLLVNFFVVFFLTLLSVYYLTKTDILTEESFSKISLLNVFLVLLFFIFCMSLISLVEFFIYRTFTNKMPYQRCLINSLLGNLGSNVTPFKVAHFPLKFYTQHSFGVHFTDSMTGVCKCQIIHSLTSIIVYSILVTSLAFTDINIIVNDTKLPMFLLVSFGLTFHIGVLVLTIILSFNVRFQKFLLGIVAKIIKIFKKNFNDKEYLFDKEAELNLFREQITIIAKKFYVYLLPMFFYVLFMLASESAVYVSYLVITKKAFSFTDLFAFYLVTLASYYMANFIPVPGGAGTTEVVFSMMFIGLINNADMGSVLILWRLSTYYLVIIVEVILLCFLPLFKKIYYTKRAIYGDFVSDDYD